MSIFLFFISAPIFQLYQGPLDCGGATTCVYPYLYHYLYHDLICTTARLTTPGMILGGPMEGHGQQAISHRKQGTSHRKQTTRYRKQERSRKQQAIFHRSLGAKRCEATSSRSDGKLKSIAENRSGFEVNLQQGEDYRRPWSKAQLRFRGQSRSNLRLLAWL